MEQFLPEPDFGNFSPALVSCGVDDKGRRRSSREVAPTVHLHYDGKGGKFTSGKTLSQLQKMRMRLTRKEALIRNVKLHAKRVAWENCHSKKVTLKLRGADYADSGHALLDLLAVACEQA